ncbi:uncharacterized protein SETTUDRAFT_44124 [Exserohilum turcica Et28A]|uniref:DUF7924 domain-containing protein n=1 Tax=Exserohilum turcicum (strain 28A) TaxID=671987 RepID=R0I9V8_EXST2|nr:uncharacterized protein SETTUDRAFT_44124 [Exserohilum turcica Et28A]EOA82255.1 hypothetical protein SETTUDRAFT_44124 [Exserohilum turcica Et28A]
MAPQTPRSTLASERHGSRRHRYTPDSQASVRFKTPPPQTYRNRNMKLASIYVDQVIELPPKIDDYIRHILGITSWKDPVTAPNELQMHPRFTKLADEFLARSRQDASRCVLEAEWQSSLHHIVRTMAESLKGAVQINMSEKIWNADLKPKPAPLMLQNEAQDGRQTPTFEQAQTASPQIDLGLDMVTDLDCSELMSPPSHSESAVSSTSTNVANPYHIRTPKPDITIGLADDAFTPQQQGLLVSHQAYKSILSDPYAAEMGFRFPFMIVETKGLSEKGTLISAQNQAAVGGACMLKILKDLTNQAARSTDLHPKQESPPTTLAELSPAPTLCFSVVTEGPEHELWVHFEREDRFYMHHLETWRTTKKSHVEELVNWLGRIIEWGKGEFKEGIVEKLGRVPEVPNT